MAGAKNRLGATRIRMIREDAVFEPVASVPDAQSNIGTTDAHGS